MGEHKTRVMATGLTKADKPPKPPKPRKIIGYALRRYLFHVEVGDQATEVRTYLTDGTSVYHKAKTGMRRLRPDANEAKRVLAAFAYDKQQVEIARLEDAGAPPSDFPPRLLPPAGWVREK